jgi:CheY-like chemotaxis protein
MKKILIVEDSQLLQMVWKKTFAGKLEVICAFSVSEAEEKFTIHSDIIAIVMDGCVPGTEFNTGPLVIKFRAKFTGPIIAVSSFPHLRQELVSAGCSHQCDKMFLPQKLREVLNLQN